MVFEKPKDMKYTDMCIYIDKNSYGEDCDEETLYSYLWLLVDMLARKSCYFLDKQTHTQFCFWSANYLFYRIRHPKIQCGKTYDDTRIVNVLDYLKKSLPLLKIKFMSTSNPQKNTRQIDAIYSHNSMDILNQLVVDGADREKKIDFSSSIDSCCSVVLECVKDTPFGGTKEETPLYISVLCSLLNMTTLSNSSKEFLHKDRKRNTVTDGVIEGLYKKERKNFVILYHLDDSMKDLVRVLTIKSFNRIRKILEDVLAQ